MDDSAQTHSLLYSVHGFQKISLILKDFKLVQQLNLTYK